MRRLACVILFLGAFQVSCGGSPAPQPAPQPPATPTGGNNPAGGEAPGEAPECNSVHEDFTNDAIAPTDCNYPWHFTVGRNGHYRVGPCTESNTQVTGNINSQELSELSRRVQVVAAQDLEATRQCEAFGLIASDEVDITLSSGENWHVLDASPQSICYRGGKENAKSLASYFNSLTRKYYPRRSPE